MPFPGMPGCLPVAPGIDVSFVFEAAITLSILRIIEAVSVAALMTFCFTERGSYMSIDAISAILAFSTSIPNLGLSEDDVFERRYTCVSITSIPAFLASVNGTDSSASAYLSAANCSRPGKDPAHSLIFWETRASGAPPPGTMYGCWTTSFTHIKASCTDLSASSTTLWDPPCISIDIDLGSLQPSIKTHLLFSTFLSSTNCEEPRSFSDNSSTF